MARAPKKHQLSILAAGTFANILMTVVFGLIMWGFFALSFTPGGIIFNAYAQSVVNVSDITHVGNVSIMNVKDIPTLTVEGLNEMTVAGSKYYAPEKGLSEDILMNNNQIVVFDDAPALRANLFGAIKSIDGKSTRSKEELSIVLDGLIPNENVRVVAVDSDGTERSYDITLGNKNDKAYLGIGFYARPTEGLRAKLMNVLAKIRDPSIHYITTWDGDFVQFIYDLLWWIVMINVLVALMNMLPVSILDGGRFFYLTIAGITGSSEWGKKAYSWITWFILILISLMMTKWIVNFVIN